MRWLAILALAGATVAPVGAAEKKEKLVELSCEDLYKGGTDLLARGKRSDARTYLRRYEQRCPRGTDIEQAKLAIARSFFAESALDLKVEGVATCRQIISFYPDHAAACECQLLIADYHFRQMRACDRDQDETRQAVSEYEKLLSGYPNCEWVGSAKERLAAARDRLACSDFEVARYYKRVGETRAAEHRLADLMRDYPTFSRGCEVARLRIELLAKLGDLDTARSTLAKMSENCTDAREVGRAGKLVGVAPVLESDERERER